MDCNVQTLEEMRFLDAIESYKRENDKLFLSWREVLGIVKELGYQNGDGDA